VITTPAGRVGAGRALDAAERCEAARQLRAKVDESRESDDAAIGRCEDQRASLVTLFADAAIGSIDDPSITWDFCRDLRCCPEVYSRSAASLVVSRILTA
jgi:hypothetical protein